MQRRSFSVGEYRRHAVSKRARKAHKRRDQKAKRAAKKKGLLLDPFAYLDIRGKSKKTLACRLGSVR